MVTRVKGRSALERRLLGLLFAVHRFGTRRARTATDQAWAASVIAGLETLLQDGKPHAP
jgi:hypothetical protein